MQDCQIPPPSAPPPPPPRIYLSSSFYPVIITFGSKSVAVFLKKGKLRCDFPNVIDFKYITGPSMVLHSH